MNPHICECCGQRKPVTPKVKAKQIAEARARNAAGESAAVLAEPFGVSISTMQEWCAGAKREARALVPPVVRRVNASPLHPDAIVPRALSQRSTLAACWSGA